MNTKGIQKNEVEKPHQLAAFTYYYSMGNLRSMRKTAEHEKVSLTTIRRWSQQFNWKERIEIKDTKFAKQAEQKVDDKNEAMKGRILNDVDGALGILRAAMVEKMKYMEVENNKAKVENRLPQNFDDMKSTKEILDISKSLKELVMLRGTLTGEIDSKIITLRLPDELSDM